jgi:hypothetical protein
LILYFGSPDCRSPLFQKGGTLGRTRREDTDTYVTHNGRRPSTQKRVRANEACAQEAARHDRLAVRNSERWVGTARLDVAGLSIGRQVPQANLPDGGVWPSVRRGTWGSGGALGNWHASGTRGAGVLGVCAPLVSCLWHAACVWRSPTLSSCPLT